MTGPAALHVELLSDTCVSAGAPGGGEVDVEADCDERGLPRIGGKALRGLLRDSWLAMATAFEELQVAAEELLGRPGARLVDDTARLVVGTATVEPDLAAWVTAAELRGANALDANDVLRALTAVRSRTAEDRRTGVPALGSLRQLRVVRRGLVLRAPIEVWEPGEEHLRVLALAALGVRNVGVGRSRGLGLVRLTLDGELGATLRLAGLPS